MVVTVADLQTFVTQLEKLDEASYERGRVDGFKAGYAQAKSDFAAALDRLELAVAPLDQHKLEGAPKAKQRKQHKLRKSGKTAQKLVAFVEEHPGTTAANVISAIQIPKDAPYRAYRRGLIRKVGKQFYPLDAGA